MSKIIDFFNKSVSETIETWGKEITAYVNSTANCSSCAYNPITKDATNPSCSTCNGKFFFNSATSHSFKAICRNFLGDKAYYDYGTHKINFYPDADVRVTCWLEDVLLDDSGNSELTYFDRTDRVSIGTKNYKVKKVYLEGLDQNRICVVNLEEIKL